MVELLPLAMVEPQAVEALLDAAFGADRHNRTAYRLREGMAAIPELSFAVVEGDVLAGTIQCWPVAHFGQNGAVTPLVMVGPVAVRPDVQRAGLGRLLMDAALVAAEAKAEGALMMIGDPEYYARFFAFDATATTEWQLPGPFVRRRLLARGIGDHLPPTATGMIGPRGAGMVAS